MRYEELKCHFEKWLISFLSAAPGNPSCPVWFWSYWHASGLWESCWWMHSSHPEQRFHLSSLKMEFKHFGGRIWGPFHFTSFWSRSVCGETGEQKNSQCSGSHFPLCGHRQSCLKWLSNKGKRSRRIISSCNKNVTFNQKGIPPFRTHQVCCCLAAQSCLTLCDPMDYSPPGSSVRGISQARILEWVTISYSRGFSQSNSGYVGAKLNLCSNPGSHFQRR